ncbi:MAG: hypothetical protein DRJ11_00220 [Candidatus Aminicenantes bacterium]|nr:MAG: hypothetical protein DRJ11_00220 [Candidatus Aminicenantes bacterium]
MKIKEINLPRYGPLRERYFKNLGSFNLFWGENEEGKTLLIEALLKMLFGKKARGLPGIDRVEEFPEGFVILELAGGEEIKLPQDGDLNSLFDLPVSEGENIFIIRNSELALSRQKEGEFRFYTEFTDRLLGLQTQKIKKLKSVLQKMGRLTRPESDAPLSGSKEVEFMARRVKVAEELIKEMEELQEQIEEKGWADLERALAFDQEKYRLINNQLDLLEKARLRDLYQQGKQALRELRESWQVWPELAKFQPDLKVSWLRAQDGLQIHQKELDRELQALEKKKQALQQKEEEWRKKQEEKAALEEKRLQARGQLQDLVREYQERLAHQSQESSGLSFWQKFFWGSLVLVILPALAWLIQPHFILAVVAAGGFLGFIFSSVKIISLRRQQGQLESLWVRLANRAAALGLRATSFQELLAQLARLEEAGSRLEKEIGGLEEARRQLRVDLAEIEAKVEERRQTMASDTETLNQLRQSTGVTSLKELEEKIAQAAHHKSVLDRTQAFLEQNFQRISEDLAANLEYWQQKLSALVSFQEVPAEVVYSEEEKIRSESELQILKEKIEETSQSLAALRQRLAHLEDKINREVQLPEYYRCGTIEEMVVVKEKLEEFINQILEEKYLVSRVLEILEEIEAEERDKITFLFGDESQVSEYFRKITGNRYHSVAYDGEEMSLVVQSEEGKPLKATQLSAGTYDQLYFAVRLALGEKRFPQEKAFFILDDPLVKADPRRLLAQLELLQEIVEMGWQIFYFSAKGEIKEALQNDIQAGRVTYISF